MISHSCEDSSYGDLGMGFVKLYPESLKSCLWGIQGFAEVLIDITFIGWDIHILCLWGFGISISRRRINPKSFISKLSTYIIRLLITFKNYIIIKSL
jgi:hypothetical protein